MPNFWMVSNRNLVVPGSNDPLGKTLGGTTYWTSDASTARDMAAWKMVNPDEFRSQLIAEANKFPAYADENHEKQKHLTLFVHGYNNDAYGATEHYDNLVKTLYSGPEGMGICVLFSWPSNGNPAAYLADRSDARRSAGALTDLLSELFDWLTQKQIDAAMDSAKACRAKTSVISHSMGNYLVQCAMESVWTRKNRPLLMSLINQLVMVAADVDNDLFKDGETIKDSMGEGVMNLAYRISALYTGRDPILGVPAGLKHFGKRRLGRSGLDRRMLPPDNVWDLDCTELMTSISSLSIHGGYFVEPKTMTLMGDILRGIDRNFVIAQNGLKREHSWP